MKLILITIKYFAGGVALFGIYMAAGLLLHGVAQLENEGLAKIPETRDEVQGRLKTGLLLIAVGFGGSLVFQTASVCSAGLPGVSRARILKAVFEGLVFWGGACLFLCLLLLGGSVHARWSVAPAYYWLAGGAGGMALILLLAAGFFYHPQTSGEGSSPGAVAKN